VITARMPHVPMLYPCSALRSLLCGAEPPANQRATGSSTQKQTGRNQGWVELEVTLTKGESSPCPPCWCCSKSNHRIACGAAWFQLSAWNLSRSATERKAAHTEHRARQGASEAVESRGASTLTPHCCVLQPFLVSSVPSVLVPAVVSSCFAISMIRTLRPSPRRDACIRSQHTHTTRRKHSTRESGGTGRWRHEAMPLLLPFLRPGH
jgi:hypothetical protein